MNFKEFLDTVKEAFKGKKKTAKEYRAIGKIEKEDAEELEYFVTAVNEYLAGIKLDQLTPKERAIVYNIAVEDYSKKYETTNKAEVGVKIFYLILQDRGMDQKEMVKKVTDNKDEFEKVLKKLEEFAGKIYEKSEKQPYAVQYAGVAAQLKQMQGSSKGQSAQKPKQEETPKASSPKANNVKASFIPAGPKAKEEAKKQNIKFEHWDTKLTKAEEAAAAVQVAGKKNPPPVPKRGVKPGRSGSDSDIL